MSFFFHQHGSIFQSVTELILLLELKSYLIFELIQSEEKHCLNKFISVLTPVYNEKTTLRTSIDRIQKALDSYKFEIIIVDDNSPDGTGELADSISDDFSNISVLHRPKKLGLGTAYKDAFQFAKGDLIVSIDSDLSHDPSYLPKMLELTKNYDIVIGSRICRGGKIVGRSFIRDLASYLTNFFITLVLLTPIRDWTSGLRVYRRCVWTEIMPFVHCNKWDFQFEGLYKSLKSGKLACEIPITFYERAEGSSKFSTMDALVFIESFIKIILGIK